jgi:hypothetical protein
LQRVWSWVTRRTAPSATVAAPTAPSAAPADVPPARAHAAVVVHFSPSLDAHGTDAVFVRRGGGAWSGGAPGGVVDDADSALGPGPVVEELLRAAVVGATGAGAAEGAVGEGALPSGPDTASAVHAFAAVRVGGVALVWPGAAAGAPGQALLCVLAAVGDAVMALLARPRGEA